MCIDDCRNEGVSVASFYAGNMAGAAGRAESASPQLSSPALPLLRSWNREAQLKIWAWDVLICHAGEDKAFGMRLFWRLLQSGLRTFLDERTYAGPYLDDRAMVAAKAAVVDPQFVLVLLSEGFFAEARLQRELHRFLGQHSKVNTLVPVFYSVSVQRCEPQSFFLAALNRGSVLVCCACEFG